MADLGVGALCIVSPGSHPHGSDAVTVVQRGVQQRHSPAAIEQDEYEEKCLEPDEPGPEHGGI
jgi:hypothetical protein